MDPHAWTSRFAEEYSVFNSTPGHLNSSRDAFTAPTPAAAPAALHARTPSFLSKPSLSACDIAAGIASHANHFSSNPDLPSVDPSLRLSSSRVPPNTRPEYSPPPDTPQTQGVAGPDSKINGSHTGENQEPPTQTATPPPSARKADRKLVPGSTQSTMQNDEGYGHQDFLGASQPADMAPFAAAQNDMFGYPMSAPVTASPSFWDASISMTAMDLDFSGQNPTTSGMLFETPASSQQPGETYDGSANAALFQDPSSVPNIPPQSSNQENIQPAARKERPLVPKPTVPGPTTQPSATSAESSGTYSTTDNNGFVLSPGSGVDPGLLFSRPPSSDVNTRSFQPVSRPEPGAGVLAEPAPLIPSNPGSDGVKRSFSYKETNGRGARRTASSHTKPTWPKAGLQRSFSENKGSSSSRRQLPALAPAVRPQPQQAIGSGVASNRPQPRQSGRISPSKLQHRLSGLSSIPESSRPRTRTSVKFTIDARGRAHAETTTVVDEPGPNGVYRRSSRDSGRHIRTMESDPDDSDADDEPIIIPSRNASFALPDPHKPVGSIFHSSGRRSPRIRASFSFDDRNRRRHSPDDDDESEAETVVDGAGKGDATSELRKVVEDRQKRAASQRSRWVDTGSFTWAAGNLMSPTTLTDSSVPTPSTGPRHCRIRCVCQRNEPGGAIDAFMVRWYVRCPHLGGRSCVYGMYCVLTGRLANLYGKSEACELWLHGKCINITRRDMPPVYICAFCANTPNMRGGRIRDTGRSGMAHAPSPLAHKSFKSFR